MPAKVKQNLLPSEWEHSRTLASIFKVGLV